MKMKYFWGCIILVLAIACGKDDDGPEPTPQPQQQEEPEPPNEPNEVTVLTGVFKDAEVEGLRFETATQSGVTNAAGEFNYVEGEQVTFAVGNLVLGSAPGQELITPITLAQVEDATATIENKVAQNIAALLQTLDSDGDEGNGVTITKEVSDNLGVSEISFDQPVEAVLADIVLNVVQNTGIEIQLVYPNEAANNMASSLGIDYEAPENEAISILIPTLKAYLETWDYNYTLPTSVYKTSFDTTGKLMMLEVISRYSGKKFFDFSFNNHNMVGLPTSGELTRYNSNRLNGTTSTFETSTNSFNLSYNPNNQLESFDLLFSGGGLSSEKFTSFDENNRPLTFFEEFDVEDPNSDFTVNWTLTYDDDGRIATADRLFDNMQTIDANNSFRTITTRDFNYSYDENGNLSTITYDRVFEDVVVTDGNQQNSRFVSNVVESFAYDSSNKLTEFVANETLIPDQGESYTSTQTRTYDASEQLTSYLYVDSRGVVTNTDYQEGIIGNSQTFRDDLITSETEIFADGSQTTTNYFYFEGELVEKEIIVYGPNFELLTITFELYDNGVISSSFVSEYVGGILNITTGLDANGNIVFRDFYDESGFIIQTDFYFEGAISSSQEFSYDDNGFTSQVIFKDSDGNIVQINNYTRNAFGDILTVEGLFADGSLWFNETWEYDGNGLLSQITVNYFDGFTDIYFYEEGVLVRGEFYDADGNLYDTVDYTTTGRSIGKSGLRYKKSQQLNATEPLFEAERNEDWNAISAKGNVRLLTTPKRVEKNAVLLQYLKVTQRDGHGHDHRK